jgi:hypothetical protein
MASLDQTVQKTYHVPGPLLNAPHVATQLDGHQMHMMHNLANMHHLRGLTNEFHSSADKMSVLCFSTIFIMKTA